MCLHRNIHILQSVQEVRQKNKTWPICRLRTVSTGYKLFRVTLAHSCCVADERDVCLKWNVVFCSFIDLYLLIPIQGNANRGYPNIHWAEHPPCCFILFWTVMTYYSASKMAIKASDLNFWCLKEPIFVHRLIFIWNIISK